MLRELLAKLSGRQAMPRPNARFDIKPCDDVDAVELNADEVESAELTPISGFVCVICYTDAAGNPSERMIRCIRYETIDGQGAICAICSEANGYRRFLAARIGEVFDAYTGEHLGDGTYFGRFAVDKASTRPSMWGLIRSQRDHLLAGLNVLAFMARSDGEWHWLEEEPVSDFICRLWMRKEWEGDPPVTEIVEHAQRLSPDAHMFCRSLENIAHSTTSTRLLKATVAELIDADGVVHADEFKWAIAMQEVIDEVGGRERQA